MPDYPFDENGFEEAHGHGNLNDGRGCVRMINVAIVLVLVAMTIFIVVIASRWLGG